ncbi:MAG: oligo-1,6-glucosidase [Flavobacterium sp.]
MNAEEQNSNPQSVLNYFRKLVKLRKQNSVLVYGTYTLLDRENTAVYSYTRELNGKKLLILLNFTDKTATYNLDFKLGKHAVLLGNYNDCTKAKNSILRPYESIIIEFD